VEFSRGIIFTKFEGRTSTRSLHKHVFLSEH